MKVLNLYAGIGGNRKLWNGVEVTAVEHNKDIAQIYSDSFPDDKIIVDNAHKYLLDHYEEYDFIWASPPCPTHSGMMRLQVQSQHKLNVNRKAKYPDMNLYQEVIILNNFFRGKFCIENTIAYYEPLIKPQKLYRHYFWANFIISKINNDILDIDKIGTVYSNSEELMKHYNMFVDFKNYNTKSFIKDQVIRNCVHPKLGKHIFDCAFKIKQKTLGGQEKPVIVV